MSWVTLLKYCPRDAHRMNILSPKFKDATQGGEEVGGVVAGSRPIKGRSVPLLSRDVPSADLNRLSC
ncbi:MAG: hypothetical protein ACI9BW_000205 [Gammaproteobacteria bacterium]|jgi:hypothetical protein